MRLRHLPKFAVVLLTLVTAIAVSGTAYALYSLWRQPTVHTQPVQQNQFGRKEVTAAFENCASHEGQSMYEIKKVATIDQTEVSKILQARCEMDIIRKALGEHTESPTKNGQTTHTTTLSPVAFKVVSLETNKLALTGDTYNTPKGSLPLNSATKFIVDGRMAKRDDIKPGDTVLYHHITTLKARIVTTPTGTSITSDITDDKVDYVIKVDLPVEYYGPGKQNQIAQRTACLGNPEDSCVEASGIDLYVNYGTKASAEELASGAKQYRQLQGTMLGYNDHQVQIKTTSGRIVTVTTPNNIIDTFNATRSNTYGMSVKVGDTLNISYIENKNESGTTIVNDKIDMITVLLDIIHKDDPLKAY